MKSIIPGVNLKGMHSVYIITIIDYYLNNSIIQINLNNNEYYNNYKFCII